MWVLKWAFIQDRFRTALVPDIYKAEIFHFYFSTDTEWFQYGGNEDVLFSMSFRTI